MNCLTARQILELARPDEVGGREVEEAVRHIGDCPPCETAVRRQEQLDARLGELCRDVPVPAGLKESLLVRLDAAPHSEAVAAGPAAPMAAVKTPLRSRRQWLGAISLAAACVVITGLGVWSLWPSPDWINLDEVTSLVSTAELEPAQLGEFARFRNGLAPKAPDTMITPPLVQPPRRLGDDVAVYFFTIPLRRVTLAGRLVVIPINRVKPDDIPSATSFTEGLITYKAGFCTTAWVEGDFVYVCCLSG
jgi:hypothetical protein